MVVPVPYGSSDNFVGKSEELVFDAFSDPEPVKRA